jgi:hypothetical protein
MTRTLVALCALVFCALAITSQIANATWKTNSTTDPLTKEKRPYMSSAGHGAIRQFGRTVSSQLVIYCVPLPNQGVPFPSVDLWFSEKVAVGNAKARFRFDTGLVHVGEMESDRGNQFSLLRGLKASESNLYWDEFKTSNKLRVQVDLPWAGGTVIEFDTSGASEALDKIPCEEW